MRSMTTWPNPVLAGAVTGGPPDSSQDNFINLSLAAPLMTHRIDMDPVSLDKAPCLAAFVDSS